MVDIFRLVPLLLGGVVGDGSLQKEPVQQWMSHLVTFVDGSVKLHAVFVSGLHIFALPQPLL